MVHIRTKNVQAFALNIMHFSCQVSELTAHLVHILFQFLEIVWDIDLGLRRWCGLVRNHVIIERYIGRFTTVALGGHASGGQRVHSGTEEEQKSEQSEHLHGTH